MVAAWLTSALVDRVAPVIDRREIGGGADRAADFGPTAADSTDQMVVIVAVKCLRSVMALIVARMERDGQHVGFAIVGSLDLGSGEAAGSGASRAFGAPQQLYVGDV